VAEHEAPQSLAPGGQAELAQLLSGLRQRFAEQLDERLQSIGGQLQRLAASGTDSVDLDALHREVHGLTGAAGTFGLSEVSRRARALEAPLAALLRDGTVPDAALHQTLQQAMAALVAAVPAGPGSPPVPDPAPPVSPPAADAATGPCVFHQGSADMADAGWTDTLQAAGYRTEPVTDLAALCRAWALQPPPAGTVLLLDLPTPMAVQPTLDRLQDLARPPGGLLVLAALAGDDLALRLRLARAGVRRTLPRPLVAERLVEQLDTLTGRRPDHPYRVLLVDDDPLLLQAQAAVLRDAGMAVRVTDHPLQTLQLLEDFHPDVLLLDVYMPEASGPELAAILREREAWLDLPVLFLSAETELSQQLLALNLGGDDFLVKPVQPDHLVAAVSARARRARQNAALRRRLQTELYEREREHLALDQHAIVSVADPKGHILYANDLFCRISGYSHEQVIGLSHHVLRSAVHPAAFYDAMRETIFAGRVWRDEICCRRADGSLYWTETTITPFMDDQGRLYQYAAIQTDITHIKAVEATLRQQRDMQRVISLSAADLMAAAPGEAPAVIDQVLAASGTQLQAERAYLYTFARDARHFNAGHVWCAPGIAPMPEDVHEAALDQLPWLQAHLSADGVLQLHDVQLLGPDDAPPRELLQRCGVRSLLVLGLQHKGRPIGFLAYSTQHMPRVWSDAEVALLKVLRDVMASALLRNWTDAALRKSKSRLNFLVSSSPVTIHSREPQAPFALRYVSPNVMELLGFDATALTKGCTQLESSLHPDDRAAVASGRPAVLQDDALRLEYRLRLPQGGYRWVLEQSRLVRDDAGQPLEIIGYWMDITDRKRFEAELSAFNQELEQRVEAQTRNVLQSERLAQATLDAMSARVVMLDGRGHIVATNRAWRDFAGGRSARQAESYLQYCEQGDPQRGLPALPALVAAIRSVMDGQQRSAMLENSVVINGESHWFVSRVERFGSREEPRIVVSHEDITALKLAERAQLRSQRLESLGTLAGGVAHDLNNALAPVLMGMNLLKEQYPEESRLFEMIEGSARRGADMVRQLLTFARGAEGERVPVQPQPLLREIERLMKGSFPKNIELRVQADDGLPPVVGDATQLHQVLLNLCVNARDAMPGGGTLALRAQTVELDEAYARSISDARPGHYLALKVSDTGSGIPADILDRIFDPFFTTKSADRGTGLGLSTVLGIVRSHGGFVQVYSQPGQGSLFTVYLPVAEPSAQAKAAVDMPGAGFQGHGETVLFVDDEAAVREVGYTVLERLNVVPVLATDGADGLVQATTHRDQLRAVITDLHMPHMDGLAFVRALRRNLPDVPVILASGRVDEGTAADMQSLGVTLRLDKPFTQEQLARALQAVLGG
jgi:PAS domain S-box-containing protein